jgi:predicted anti-sigma-YlaC factor YlaD
MDCIRFELALSDYLDSALSRDEASLFRKHALQCRACRGLMDDVKTVISDCANHDDLETAPGLEAALVMIPFEQLPLDCVGFEEVITEFLDGFVPASTYHKFEEHAGACSNCSELLTDVVYAVAACHSVHTYEEYDVPECLAERLLRIVPKSKQRSRRIADRVAAMAAFLMPRRTQTAGWSFATTSALAFAAAALLVFDFSDDLSVRGIYRKARVTAAEIYSRGSDIYAQKDEVVGRLQEVGSDIDEIWDTLGGDPAPGSQATNVKAGPAPSDVKSVESPSSPEGR